MKKCLLFFFLALTLQSISFTSYGQLGKVNEPQLTDSVFKEFKKCIYSLKRTKIDCIFLGYADTINFEGVQFKLKYVERIEPKPSPADIYKRSGNGVESDGYALGEAPGGFFAQWCSKIGTDYIEQNHIIGGERIPLTTYYYEIIRTEDEY